MYTDFRNEWLSELGQRLNIPALEFDSAGLCQLILDDEWMITICKPAEAENLVLFGQLPVRCLSTEIMQQMLVGNRKHSTLAAPVLSLSDSLDKLEIHFKLTHSELQSTEDAMGQLVDTLDYWSDQMTKV